MDSLDVVKDMLRALAERPEPFVKEIRRRRGVGRSGTCSCSVRICIRSTRPCCHAGGCWRVITTSQPREDASAALADRVTRLEGE
jgi:hypothetical protein